jgi:hypothetical protein
MGKRQETFLSSTVTLRPNFHSAEVKKNIRSRGFVRKYGDRFDYIENFDISSLNLCTGRPPIGVMIPEAVQYNFDLLTMSTCARNM